MKNYISLYRNNAKIYIPSNLTYFFKQYVRVGLDIKKKILIIKPLKSKEKGYGKLSNKYNSYNKEKIVAKTLSSRYLFNILDKVNINNNSNYVRVPCTIEDDMIYCQLINNWYGNKISKISIDVDIKWLDIENNGQHSDVFITLRFDGYLKQLFLNKQVCKKFIKKDINNLYFKTTINKEKKLLILKQVNENEDYNKNIKCKINKKDNIIITGAEFIIEMKNIIEHKLDTSNRYKAFYDEDKDAIVVDFNQRIEKF